MWLRKSWFGVVLATLAVVPVGGQQLSDLAVLAREAYVFAYPALESYRTMSEAVLTEQARRSGGAFNRFKLFPLADSESRWIVRPNDDTLYSSAWLDLRRGPVVITVPRAPEGRYRSLQLIDLFMHNFAIVGGGDTQGGRYLVVGPTWAGQRLSIDDWIIGGRRGTLTS